MHVLSFSCLFLVVIVVVMLWFCLWFLESGSWFNSLVFCFVFEPYAFVVLLLDFAYLLFKSLVITAGIHPPLVHTYY